MSVAVAAKQINQAIDNMITSGDTDMTLNQSHEAVGLARIGSETQKIIYCSLKDMESVDLGPPLHSLVIPGKMHPLEMDMLSMFRQLK